MDTPTGARFAPVSPDELIQRLGHHVQNILRIAQGALDEVSSLPDEGYIWNVRGHAALLDHARSLIDATGDQLLIALWPDEALALTQPLSRAEARGVNVTTLCLMACPTACGGCRGQIYPYRMAQEPVGRWLVLIPDHAEVLAGEIGTSEETLAVRTRQGLLVE